MALIPLSVRPGRDPLFVEVDDDDFDTLSQVRWFADRKANHTYAARYNCQVKPKKWVMMHRLLIQAPDDMQVDHIDGNGLNNKRANLRLVTMAENAQNARLRKDNKCGFRGVHYDTHIRWWRARIGYGGKFFHLGIFHSAEEAAQAYDDAARTFHGEYARLNFPGETERGAIDAQRRAIQARNRA